MSFRAPLIGLFRQFRSFVLGREVEIVGQCRLCGNCCHDILLRDGGWVKNKRQFKRLCERESKYFRFEILGKDDRGCLTFRCTLQQENGLCSCYDDRLPLCKSYPSKSLYYQGGWIGPKCGFRFKTVTFRDVLLRRKKVRQPSFSKVLEQEMKHSDN